MHGASSAGVYADAVESFEEELDGTDDAVAELVVGEAETHGGDIIDVDLESVVVSGGEGFGAGGGFVPVVADEECAYEVAVWV